MILAVLAALAWWLWRRRRSPERTAAELRERMGYGASDAPESESSPDWHDLIDRRDVQIVNTETTGIGDRAEVIEVAVLDDVPHGETRSNEMSGDGLVYICIPCHGTGRRPGGLTLCPHCDGRGGWPNGADSRAK